MILNLVMNLCSIKLFIIIECNPDQLSNGTGVSIPNSDVCQGSFHLTLGIENGIVCFSGTKVGSTALYYCNDCGYKELVKSAGSLIRSCKHNGQWNGSIPNCKCYSTSKSADIFLYNYVSYACFNHLGIIGSNPELLYAFGGVVVLIIFVITMCFIIVIITHIRAKGKLKVKLEQAGVSENAIYEEIHQISSSNMDTTDNVAYASHQAFST